MARAHFVKKARKADKAWGIKKGESYWYDTLPDDLPLFGIQS